VTENGARRDAGFGEVPVDEGLEVPPSGPHIGARPGGLASFTDGMVDPIGRLAGGLIVSCQAGPKDPFFGPTFMAAMARAAARGGAAAIRANGPEDIASIRAAVDLPIIGIWKVDLPGLGIRITPEIEHARAIATAGASIVALDATDRARSDGVAVADLIAQVRRETRLPVMADVSSVSEGLVAEAAGADLIATTLAGYTDGASVSAGPDLELVAQLAPRLRVPLIAEGRFSTPDEAAQAIANGAYAVVVGHAITRPDWITARFVAAVGIR
jgi:N-acylglucosamine-6-phosphate 2-epimerase